MSEIVKFAFVLTQNLDLESFKVPQAMAQIDVKGAEDPLTHQKARDVVKDLFVNTQKRINEDIVQRDLRIKRMGVNERRQKKKGEIDAGNKKIQDLLNAFKHDAQARLEEWKKREAEREAKALDAEVREDWRGVNFVINSFWTGIKLVMEVKGAVEAPPTIPAAVNSFVSNLMEIKGLFEAYEKIYADCPTLRNKIKADLNTLKSKPKLTKSEVEAFGKDVDMLEDKLLVLETKTKAMSARVTGLIANMPKKDVVRPEALEKAQKTLDTCLKGLVDASAEVNKATRYMVTLRKNLGVAKAAAKADPNYATVLSFVVNVYKGFNDFKDFVLSPEEWVTQVDGCIKYFSFIGNWTILNEKQAGV